MSLADNLPNQPRPWRASLIDRIPLARMIWDAEPRNLARAALILSMLAFAGVASTFGLDPMAAKALVLDLLRDTPAPEATPTPIPPVEPTPALQPHGDWRDGNDVRAI